MSSIDLPGPDLGGTAASSPAARRRFHATPPIVIALLVLPLLSASRAPAAGPPEALQLIDRLQERMSQCRDYQYLVDSFERKGDQKEKRSYRLFVKDSRQ